MKRAFLVFIAVSLYISVNATKVTIHAVDRSAEDVFAEIMAQTNLNFVYPSDLLTDLTVTVDAKNKPLGKVLSAMFKGSDVTFRIKGDKVILMRKAKPKPLPLPSAEPIYVLPAAEPSEKLEEVVVLGTRNQSIALDATDNGTITLNNSNIMNTPVVGGEIDIIKTLHHQPGVAPGVEGFAGLLVHGGENDENLITIDNVPVYQSGHIGGIFSAYNTDVIDKVDFYKSTFPSRFDGRLSSVLDVRTKDGSTESHHGSFRLGLISGAFNIDGPIRKGTTSYSFGLRRTWLDAILAPTMAYINSREESLKNYLNFNFNDLNAKIVHRFNEDSKLSAGIYYSSDYFKGGTDDIFGTDSSSTTIYNEKGRTKLRWDNLAVSLNWTKRFSDKFTGEFTAALSRLYTKISSKNILNNNFNDPPTYDHTFVRLKGLINDWILRGDMAWHPDERNSVRFGASFTNHRIEPNSMIRESLWDQKKYSSRYISEVLKANEIRAYISDDITLTQKIRLNVGLSGTLFSVDDKIKTGISPRFSIRYLPADKLSIKLAYNRSTQFIHQISNTYISLPTDQWVPVCGDLKPMSADKISVGAFRLFPHGISLSAEAFIKWQHNIFNLIEYSYLLPNESSWISALTSGKGSAKGLDFKIMKETGKVTGHVSYSLLWADREFKDINGGKPFPARFGNRHKINILLNWRINDRWQLNAAWTGMSGNYVTFSPQVWQSPELNLGYTSEIPLFAGINNYRMPFQHHLDISSTRRTTHGYWTFSVYNVYNSHNAIAINRDYHNGRPVFKKVAIIPILPSISYTWLF